MTRIGVVTQARMTSTRLPGKILLAAGGKSMLQHHLDRLSQAHLPVYVATTTNETDDPVVAAAAELGVPVHRGSEDDVLSRFAGAIEEFGLDVVVRVTSDCPLIDGDLVRHGIDTYLTAGDPDLFVSNTLERTFPRGLDFEVFGAAALLAAHADADQPAEREHVTPYLYANRSGRTTIRQITRPTDASGFRITLDTPDDMELIRRLIEDHHAAELDAEHLIAVLESHPELASLNGHIEQKKLGE